MKNKETKFSYSDDATAFLSERKLEDHDYAQATEIFEYFIRKNRKAGSPVEKLQPVPPRSFPVKIPLLRDLDFYYWYTIQDNVISVHVFAIEFAP